ncbi:hydrolase Nlp/P60 [Cohnella kolymensis]|uniref:Hydrolase Nlp/P60 n=1 Tax=Cohnella kolymensis TaxID=1590652 RepID=A0ABR5A628_9BACL|nr:SH3 domain-containing C40 family peptidase [Cohnella kolymensis]KIL36482.1 hydrolase Nlp/P60 [Cohnella kolymensis]
MRKGILLLLASLLLLVSVPVSSAAAASLTGEIVSTVNFRNGPSTSAEVMTSLRAGQSVIVLEKLNRYWLKVKDGRGAVGYISSSSKYVKLANESEPAPTQPSEPAQPTQPTQPAPAPTTPTPAPAQPSASVEKVIQAGTQYLGTPYEFGSSRSTTTTFDCSDFVRQAFKDALQITLPADSRQQGAYVRSHNSVTTDWHQLKRGDLMFFMSYKGSKASDYANKQSFSERITHVGIYLGNGKILHTYSKTSGGVRIDSFAGKAWEYRFLFGGSAL